ncbi:SUMF1/EgtB/PvdO family nonheme iron enzyme [Candidatus Uabimicrobium sp. HlEnr_7]|uniref:SUMF1/EgtB/PvdO family nonheme iron enzyme n=1 Tax=Candidatus Uabimicrobium helgolandensis TaxID=3095367 RepID=UPI003556A78B
MGKPPFHEGDIVKSYVIDKQFNVGGMGAVYNVKHENILIKAPFSDSGDVLLAQFKEEVKALQQLSHPGIVGILDADIYAEIPWYTMEFIQGETLRAYINREAPISSLRSLRLLYHMTDSIAHAHTQSKPIWHLDIKPENICFREDKPVILDFGLARFGRSATNILGPHGTLLYMAPEQLDLRGRPDARADVYALGVIFFEMLTGNPPFGKIAEVCYENKRIDCMEKILDLGLRSPSVEGIAPSISKILDKTLAKKQEDRYQHAGEMLSDIREALTEYIQKYVTKYEKTKNYSQASRILKEGFEQGLVEEKQLERILQLEKEQQQKSLDEIFSTAKEYSNFQKSLDFIIDLVQRYEVETDVETKKRIYSTLQKVLQTEENESLPLLLEKMNTAKESLVKMIPSSVKQTKIEDNSSTNDTLEDISIVVEDEMPEEKVEEIQEPETEDSNEDEVVFEEETQVIQVPPAEMADYVASSLAMKDESPVTKEDVHLKTSDFEVILEQSQALKAENGLSDLQLKIKLPNGFHWFDDSHIICEKDESLLVYIPGGEFVMGSSETSSDIEKPEHNVYVDGFFIDKYLTTWHQFLTFCDATGHPKPTPPKWGIYEEHPVVNISWLDAKAYCIWAGKILATEAQWEKTAKGGVWLDGDDLKQQKNPYHKRTYPWGNSLPDENGTWLANYNEEPHYGRNRGQKSTSRVGSFSKGASPYGCLDMAGNVWEWCKDWYGENYYSKSPKKNPRGPGKSDATKIDSQKGEIGKVLRGGSWYTGKKFLRTTARRCRNPEGRGGSCGMRGVCNIVK